jgi:adenylate cyclase
MPGMTASVKRRLTTVLCADVEGYSRLMGADEAGTLSTLRRHREAMAALVERHDGRIVNTWGDAVIAEFSSVVEAVQCAVEIQEELSSRNDALPGPQRMNFRIGINLGDVMVDGTDIYGDGVNIAARLQEMAEPGGILISGPVYDQVHNKLSIGFDCLGQQEMRNVAHPVMSYRVAIGTAAAPTQVPRPAAAAPKNAPAHAPIRTSGPARLWAWYLSLPRPIAAILAIAVFLFAINVFTGLDSIWFHWPVASLLLVVVLWAVMRRKPF